MSTQSSSVNPANANIDPVLLCNDLGTKRDPSTPSTIIQSNGNSSMSVKEAVRIAQSNNFMGLVCSSRLLVSPPLVSSHCPLINSSTSKNLAISLILR